MHNLTSTTAEAELGENLTHDKEEHCFPINDKRDLPLGRRRLMSDHYVCGNDPSPTRKEEGGMRQIVNQLTALLEEKDRLLESTSSKLERANKMNSFLLSLSAALKMEKEELETKLETTQKDFSEVEKRLQESDQMAKRLHLRFAEDYHLVFANTATAIARIIEQHNSIDLPFKQTLSKNQRRPLEETRLALAFGKELLLNSQLQAEVERLRKRSDEDAHCCRVSCLSNKGLASRTFSFEECRPLSSPSPMRFSTIRGSPPKPVCLE